MFFLDNLLPLPLLDKIKDSDIWSCKQSLDCTKKYFLEAPSGSGKTTLQHILYGLRNDYQGGISLELEGEIHVLKTLSVDTWSRIRQHKISVVFQDLRLFAALSAMDNILLKNSLTEHKSIKEIESMCQRLGINDLLQKPCGRMSYGQQQRVAIVRALCQPFEFLIMDEPFSHLDSKNIRSCCALIQEECASQGAGFALLSLEERYSLDYDHTLVL